jgi:hypothetical protein
MFASQEYQRQQVASVDKSAARYSMSSKLPAASTADDTQRPAVLELGDGASPRRPIRRRTPAAVLLSAPPPAARSGVVVMPPDLDTRRTLKREALVTSVWLPDPGTPSYELEPVVTPTAVDSEQSRAQSAPDAAPGDLDPSSDGMLS